MFIDHSALLVSFFFKSELALYLFIRTSLAVFSYEINKFLWDFQTMEFSKSLIYFFSPFSCWMYDVSVNWIYKIPCIVSVCANLIFLLWIVFVLVSKLHTDMSDNAAVMKTFKAIGMNSYIVGQKN